MAVPRIPWLVESPHASHASISACEVQGDPVSMATTQTQAAAIASSVRHTGSGAQRQATTVSKRALGLLLAVMLLAGVAAQVQHVTCGSLFTCVLTTAEGVRCFGSNSNGQLGIGGSPTRITAPLTSDAISSVASISGSFDHTCAVTTGTGGLHCWGFGASFQLGTGGTTTIKTPPSSPVLTSVAQVATGKDFTCVRSFANQAQCWGSKYAPHDVGNYALGCKGVHGLTMLLL